MHGERNAGNLEQQLALSKVGKRLQRRNVFIVLVGMEDYDVCLGEVGNRLIADCANMEKENLVSSLRSA